MSELRRYGGVLYSPRLVRVMLYGTLTKGEAKPGSDIAMLGALNGNEREEHTCRLSQLAHKDIQAAIAYGAKATQAGHGGGIYQIDDLELGIY